MGANSRLGAYSNKYGIFLDTTTFVMRSAFVVLETTCPQIQAKSLPNFAKSPLPVDLCFSKPSMLKLPRKEY